MDAVGNAVLTCQQQLPKLAFVVQNLKAGFRLRLLTSSKASVEGRIERQTLRCYLFYSLKKD